MVPLTALGPVLKHARDWIQETIDQFEAEVGSRFSNIKIGTMVETPRATLVANELAEYADFFSFGTNDSTQMTLGFSRDEVEGRLMSLYLSEGLLAHNPFQQIDIKGVGKLVCIGMERGPQSNAFLSIGVCGEHGGNPESIDLFVELGMDYVSCSP